MGVEYGAAEFFPQVCAVYRCPCGRSVSEHGRRVDVPEGWKHLDETVVLCHDCAEKRAASEAREEPARPA